MKTPAVIFDSVTMDVGRILAATVIFYFHVGLMGHYPLSTYGEYAVEYFVILSGITYALFSNPKPATPSQYFAYVKKRLMVLFPIFLLVNVILYWGSFFHASALGRPYGFGEFLASATGVSMYLGWKYMSTVMWFMPFIIQIYLLLPLIDWFARRINPAVLLFAAFCLSCLLAQLVPVFVEDGPAATLVCKNWSPIFRLPEVCVGIIMGRLALAPGDYRKGVLAIILFGVLSLAVSQLKSDSVIPHYYMPWGGFLVPLLIFGASWLSAPILRNPDLRLMRLLGTSSFAFYLLHAAPMATVTKRFGNGGFVWVMYYLACWFLAIGITLMVVRFKNLLKPSGNQPKI